MRWLRTTLLCALAALCLPLALVWAQAAPPHLSAYATDMTGTLSADQLARLNSELLALKKSKGTQLVVLLVPTTAPQDIESYSIAVAEANKIGRQGTDDGVLLVVAKKDHRARIEVGYGLEGAIPDVAASRIIREYMTPKFRVGDFDGGIEDSVAALTKLIDGEALPAPMDNQARPRRSSGGWLHFALIALFI
ncbi:MAG: TPM domain-containing protein, partial [Xanthomonadales bacterium]|nr:TPM domain-containing protein [Xanthomonadales bacterium]